MHDGCQVQRGRSVAHEVCRVQDNSTEEVFTAVGNNPSRGAAGPVRSTIKGGSIGGIFVGISKKSSGRGKPGEEYDYRSNCLRQGRASSSFSERRRHANASSLKSGLEERLGLWGDAEETE